MIQKYALCLESDPSELVRVVSQLAGQGFVPIGGVSMVREPANPSKGIPLGVTRYSQAMVLPAERPSHPLIVNGR